jgi:hypothetical protein
MELCAPFLVTTMEDALFAKSIAEEMLQPSASPTINAPLKQSPAAVV